VVELLAHLTGDGPEVSWPDGYFRGPIDPYDDIEAQFPGV